jgi:type II secretory pathway component GspD/PulD (secretin)
MRSRLLLASAFLGVGMGAWTVPALADPGPQDQPGLVEKSPGKRPTRPEAHQGAPLLRTYLVPGGNAEAMSKVLQEFYRKVPEVKIVALGSSEVLVWAGPEQHIDIARNLQAGLPLTSIDVIPLTSLKAAQVLSTLKGMFGPKGPYLEASADRNALIVKGTREQVEEIRAALRSLGDGPESSGNLRTFSLERGDAAVLADAVAQLLPSMRGNPVRVIKPGQPGQPLPKPFAKSPKGAAAPAKKAGGEGAPPVTLTAMGNRLIAASDDAKALAIVKELVTLLTTETGEGTLEVLRLRNASAAGVARVLDELFNGRASGGASGVGKGGGFAVSGPRAERVRIVADPATNSLLVKATRLDLLTIRKLVNNELDQGDPGDAPASRVHVMMLKHATATDAVKLLREIYRKAENLVVFAADPRTNTLVVRFPPSLEAEITALVQALDRPGASTAK